MLVSLVNFPFLPMDKALDTLGNGNISSFRDVMPEVCLLPFTRTLLSSTPAIHTALFPTSDPLQHVTNRDAEGLNVVLHAR